MGLRKDIWRSAIVEAPLAEIVRRQSVAGFAVHFLPEMGPFRFLADPFGFWRDGLLHVFVETYDYRVRVGRIEVLIYDSAYRLLDRRLALAEAWHLSYPQVFEAEGEIWMLPEAHRSGGLTLYRAVEFPHRWEAVFRIGLDAVAVDATVLFHEGMWWMFYTPATSARSKVGALHVAFAERVTGPWTVHPGNPVREDMASTRPGGTACVLDGRVMLPVQDCSWTYGGAMRSLWFDRLTRDEVVTRSGPVIDVPARFGPYVEGMHTVSAAGDVTLIDVKRTELSVRGVSIEAVREGRKLWRRWRR